MSRRLATDNSDGFAKRDSLKNAFWIPQNIPTAKEGSLLFPFFCFSFLFFFFVPFFFLLLFSLSLLLSLSLSLSLSFFFLFFLLLIKTLFFFFFFLGPIKKPDGKCKCPEGCSSLSMKQLIPAKFKEDTSGFVFFFFIIP